MSVHEIKTDERGRQFIDLTPTWAAILPMWLRIAKDAYRTGKQESIKNFEAEMRRMAEAADKWNDECKRVNELADQAEYMTEVESQLDTDGTMRACCNGVGCPECEPEA